MFIDSAGSPASRMSVKMCGAVARSRNRDVGAPVIRAI